MRQLLLLCSISILMSRVWSQPVGNTATESIAPAPAEDTASTTASSVMDLSQQARSVPSGYSFCTFDIQGAGSLRLLYTFLVCRGCQGSIPVASSQTSWWQLFCIIFQSPIYSDDYKSTLETEVSSLKYAPHSALLVALCIQAYQ